MAAQNSELVHIARPYASALYDLARDEGKVEAVEHDLVGLNALAGESADFSSFLRSPVISSVEKAKAIEPILAKLSVDPLVANLVRLVARNGRLFTLTAIIAEFRRLAAEGRGEIAADVTSATPLSRQQVSALAKTLRDRIGKDVTLNEHVDPALIGGLVVKVGSRMIDSSLRSKLSAMRIAMKEVA